MPKPTSSTTDESSLSRATIYSIIHNADVAPITQNTENRIAVTALGIVLSIAIIVVFGLVMRRYNDDIRRIIGKIAKTTKLSIHQTELLLTTFVWGIVVHITVFHAPLFAIPAIAALIFNELFFIFAFFNFFIFFLFFLNLISFCSRLRRWYFFFNRS